VSVGAAAITPFVPVTGSAARRRADDDRGVDDRWWGGLKAWSVIASIASSIGSIPAAV